MKLRTPRRIVKLVRYFEGVLDSPTASDKLKAQAADRLTELFLETERGRQQREVALARAEARQRESEQPTPEQSAPAPETATERARAFLYATRKETTDAN